MKKGAISVKYISYLLKTIMKYKYKNGGIRTNIYFQGLLWSFFGLKNLVNKKKMFVEFRFENYQE
jgi:hypothetical protein